MRLDVMDKQLKALDIIEALSSIAGWISVTQISCTTGLSKSTVHRLLTALCDRGYVIRNEQTKKYRLGLKILSISSQALESLELRRHARPLMMELMQKSRETVHLVAIEGDEGVYVEKIDTPESIGLLSRVGKRVPLYCTSVGKAILAQADAGWVDGYLVRIPLVPRTAGTITDVSLLKQELEKVRIRGFAMDLEENKEGVICVAAPIIQAGGSVIGAISISGPSFRFTAGSALSYGPVIAEFCRTISWQIGYRPNRTN